ncbi:MAG: hypothetical protein WD045_02080 [Pirellulaceae bacterium]
MNADAEKPSPPPVDFTDQGEEDWVEAEVSGPTSQETYNMVSDVAIGMNLRWRDNIFQLKFIVVTTLLFTLVGGLIFRVEGTLTGFVVGLLAGLFGSGIYLMIYRAMQHSRGKHD